MKGAKVGGALVSLSRIQDTRTLESTLNRRHTDFGINTSPVGGIEDTQTLKFPPVQNRHTRPRHTYMSWAGEAECLCLDFEVCVS